MANLTNFSASADFQSAKEGEDGSEEYQFTPPECDIAIGCYLRHSVEWTIVYSIAYVLVFLIGLIGNVSVLWIVFTMRRNKNSLSSNSNKVFYGFVGNLALADLLVIIFCLPPTLLGNIFGRK